MIWSIWDILVVAFFVLQIAALVWTAMLVLRIVNGPVARVRRRGMAIWETSLTAILAGERAVENNAVPVRGILADVERIKDAVTAPDRAKSLPINYGTLRRAFGTFLMARQGLKAAGALKARLSGVSASSMVPAGPPARVRRSLPDRLGLVPPAARTLGRYLPYVRTVLGVIRQIRG